MQPSEVSGLGYLTQSMSQSFLTAAHLDKMQNNLSSTFVHHLNNSFNNMGPAFGPQANGFQLPPFNTNELAAQSMSSNSASDDAEDQQGMGVVDERKQRRMISNRESARRSRMRKQRHLDELWSQVVRLRTENRQLIDRLNDLSECHERVALENVKLKQEAEELRLAMKDMQLETTHYAILRDFEELPSDTDHLREESSHQSVVTTTIDLGDGLL